MRDDFYGLSQLVRWIGVVEDNRDPSQLGRCKIRIVGWHSDDKNLAPTDCLPWAQAQFSPGVKSFTAPKINEWVTGYFLDGKMAQHPVYDGVLPGVNFTLPPVLVTDTPLPPDGIIVEEVDTPSTNRLARGVMKNSLIDRANKNREHVCDISPEIRRAIAFARLKFSQLISAIRGFIKRVIEALNLDPSGEFSRTAELVKWFAEQIKYISDTIAEILEARNELLEVARIIRAFIDFILSLPEKLLKLLSECLAAFLESVKTGISDLLRETTTTLSGGIDETGISELVGSVESIYKDTQKIVNDTADLLTTPAQLLAVVATPTTTFDQEQAASTVLSFLSTNVPNSETYTANVNPLFAISSFNPV
jgi:hypothetical protein